MNGKLISSGANFTIMIFINTRENKDEIKSQET